ncbi:30S ribosome-binding factor RbfA [[Mycoplasma] imitans]|uniref:30S ribosome-binding factor RbfA n=1 Tax=[Mycoplasma] imitans TaxID=29560 RepID=UPI000482ECF4|nr:30S ribosome-binding factor RbfA [[Mycoplasma] imitans]
MSKIKTLRLEADIHKLLNQAISNEINNSLIKTSVITAIELSDDKSVAKIFIDCLIPNNTAKTLKAYKDASGVFRHILSKNLTIRRVPQLVFYHDDSISKGAKIDQILKEIKQEKNNKE